MPTPAAPFQPANLIPGSVFLPIIRRLPLVALMLSFGMGLAGAERASAD